MMKRLLALSLAALMLLGLLAGCKPQPPVETGAGEPTPTDSVVTPPASTSPLVVAHGDMNGRFSPFSAESAYDMDIVDIVMGQSLISYDRLGQLVFNGIEGETREYNGVDYFYNGIADGEVIYDEAAGITTYKLKLREGVKFSDGVEVTIDDVIFSYYVFSDPAYTGSTTLYSVDIQGMKEYRAGYADAKGELSVIPDAIFAAGSGGDGAGSDVYTAAQYADFWARYDQAYADSVQAIVNECVSSYASYAPDYLPGVDVSDLATNEGLQVAHGMVLWGFGACEDGVLTSNDGTEFNLAGGEFPALADYIASIDASYEGSFPEASDAGEFDGLAGSMPYGTLIDTYIGDLIKENPDLVTRSVTNISGIKKTGDYSVEVTVNGFNPAAVYQIFGIAAYPLHYYGDRAQYDYANDKFGFSYGNLDFLKAKEGSPLGCGPYKFVKFENKIVYLEANENYWKGAPKTREIQFKTTSESDIIPGIQTGTVDIGNQSMSTDRVDQIKGVNSNGELSGDILFYSAVKNLGYGYVGLNAKCVSINEERGSEASKNLRRALSTVFAVYRDLTVDTYYGDLGNIINYPMSETSWAAPVRTDAGYQIAYTRDVNGDEIYTSAMSADERYAAAEQAALGYFEAAGYTVTDGVVTAAPDGGRTTFSAWIPANGEGDHPSFLLLTKAKESLARIGINLEIRDLPSSSSGELWDGLDAETVDIWCAAWQATLDPDIYQLYHSDGLVGSGTGSNHYGIDSAILDEAILETRKSPDNEYRKEAFMVAFDEILDWGIEVPVYQRDNCYLFSEQRIDTSSLPGDMTTYYLWNMEPENVVMK